MGEHDCLLVIIEVTLLRIVLENPAVQTKLAYMGKKQ